MTMCKLSTVVVRSCPGVFVHSEALSAATFGFMNRVEFDPRLLSIDRVYEYTIS